MDEEIQSWIPGGEDTLLGGEDTKKIVIILQYCYERFVNIRNSIIFQSLDILEDGESESEEAAKSCVAHEEKASYFNKYTMLAKGNTKEFCNTFRIAENERKPFEKLLKKIIVNL